MKGKYAILWVLLLISFYGCSDKKTITDTLHRAEALMNEYPDSAYTLLQTLPVDELQQTGNRARYALLYSQALDKNYIDETNDSLINIAVDYYRTTDDVHSKFLAFYYQGRVYTNAGELHKAMLAYTEAEQLADEVKDGYLVGLQQSVALYASSLSQNGNEALLTKAFEKRELSLLEYLLEMEYYYECFQKKAEAERDLAHIWAELTAYSL